MSGQLFGAGFLDLLSFIKKIPDQSRDFSGEIPGEIPGDFFPGYNFLIKFSYAHLVRISKGFQRNFGEFSVVAY
ncbi:hypothetical protein WH95_02370 [Kiloniella litopenaei]|uniref:Uncharacterized protein n=1 Tax=Kiloniella litopenaei TaxID=1549748 RepID=A0A0M2RF68_9PROT|nr:hypothetical protein WH95_02370 [Kiloniella litopenaei]